MANASVKRQVKSRDAEIALKGVEDLHNGSDSESESESDSDSSESSGSSSSVDEESGSVPSNKAQQRRRFSAAAAMKNFKGKFQSARQLKKKIGSKRDVKHLEDVSPTGAQQSQDISWNPSEYSGGSNSPKKPTSIRRINADEYDPSPQSNQRKSMMAKQLSSPVLGHISQRRKTKKGSQGMNLSQRKLMTKQYSQKLVNNGQSALAKSQSTRVLNTQPACPPSPGKNIALKTSTFSKSKMMLVADCEPYHKSENTLLQQKEMTEKERLDFLALSPRKISSRNLSKPNREEHTSWKRKSIRNMMSPLRGKRRSSIGGKGKTSNIIPDCEPSEVTESAYDDDLIIEQKERLAYLSLSPGKKIVSKTSPGDSTMDDLRSKSSRRSASKSTDSSDGPLILPDCVALEDIDNNPPPPPPDTPKSKNSLTGGLRKMLSKRFSKRTIGESKLDGTKAMSERDLKVQASDQDDRPSGFRKMMSKRFSTRDVAAASPTAISKSKSARHQDSKPASLSPKKKPSKTSNDEGNVQEKVPESAVERPKRRSSVTGGKVHVPVSGVEKQKRRSSMKAGMVQPTTAVEKPKSTSSLKETKVPGPEGAVDKATSRSSGGKAEKKKKKKKKKDKKQKETSNADSSSRGTPAANDPSPCTSPPRARHGEVEKAEETSATASESSRSSCSVSRPRQRRHSLSNPSGSPVVMTENKQRLAQACLLAVPASPRKQGNASPRRRRPSLSSKKFSDEHTIGSGMSGMTGVQSVRTAVPARSRPCVESVSPRKRLSDNHAATSASTHVHGAPCGLTSGASLPSAVNHKKNLRNFMTESESGKKEKRRPQDEQSRDEQSMGRLFRPPFLTDDASCVSDAVSLTSYKNEAKPPVVGQTKGYNNVLAPNLAGEEDGPESLGFMDGSGELTETSREFQLGFPCKA